MSIFISRPAEESDLTTLNAPAKKTQWQKMNRIQKVGVITSFTLLITGIPHFGLFTVVVSLAAYTTLFLGFVAGALWKVRHALHFWWSTSISFLVHCCLTPVFLSLIKRQTAQQGAGWKTYMYLLVGLTCVEVVICVMVSKRIAVWQLKRSGRKFPEQREVGPGSLLA